MIQLILGIILFSISFILFISVYEERDSGKISYNGFVVVLLLTFSLFGFLLGLYGAEERAKKNASIECLRGENPYAMHIRYEIKDSFFFVF